MAKKTTETKPKPNKLARFLKARGLSAAEAASRIHLAQSALHRIIVKGEAPSLRTASRIVAASNGKVTYEDLLPEEARSVAKQFRGKL